MGLSIVRPTNTQTVKEVSADYTITVDDIVAGKIIVVTGESADVTLTLPAISTLPADGISRNFSIGHIGSAYCVKLATHLGDHFVYATTNTLFEIGKGSYHFTLAGIYNGSAGRWGFQTHTTIKASGHRDANWDSSNFTSATVVPFDAEAYNNNSQLLVYTSGATSRYTIKTAGSYLVSFMIDLDSTGGLTWNALAQVYKNGVAIDTLQARTGNYGNEDQSLACVPAYIELAVDDYIDLRINQNNLTGALTHAMLNIETKL